MLASRWPCVIDLVAYTTYGLLSCPVCSCSIVSRFLIKCHCQTPSERTSGNVHLSDVFVHWCLSFLDVFLISFIKMSELTSDDDEDTANLVSATIIFSSCTLLFCLKRKRVILDRRFFLCLTVTIP